MARSTRTPSSSSEQETQESEMVSEREFSDLKRDHENLLKKFDDFVDEQRLEDSRKLRTALIAAGAVILALGGFVWAEIIWPVIKLGR